MKTFVILTIIAMASCQEFLKETPADELSREFAFWATKNSKKYTSFEEFKHREQVFRMNIVKMANAYSNLGTEQGIEWSPFMDVTEEEFAQTHFGFNYDAEKAEELRATSAPLEQKFNLGENVPEAFDWTEKGAVTAVKNQGACGSCWAFSTTGNLEGQLKLAKGKNVALSEQELVDCDKIDQGCNGGLMENAFDELQRLGGIVSQEDYPYEGRGSTCRLDKSQVVAQVKSYSFIDSDEEKLKEALFHNGPIAVALNATPLQFYFGGVFHPWKIFCSPKLLNHGVLLVGYGEENGKKFWNVKNSWGTGFGNKGYFKIFRGDGTCGINTHAITATLA